MNAMALAMQAASNAWRSEEGGVTPPSSAAEFLVLGVLAIGFFFWLMHGVKKGP